ncbi:MAG: VTT domain-containing protein [Verrucomicrobiota bacterium]|nr:VTT domain-containing protein [Verrucomicrobiota bacterium]
MLAAVLLLVIVPFIVFGGAVNLWTERLIAQAGARPLLTGALLALLLASDIVMPVPSSLVSTACGLTLGFWWGTCASFAGMTLTALAGYAIGRYASERAGRFIGAGEFALLQAFHRRHGVWLLLALRPVPVMAEASVVFSGVSRQPFWPVAAVTTLGNLAVSAVYAAIGVWGALSDSFIPAFLASMGLSGVMLLGMRMTGKKDGGTGR